MPNALPQKSRVVVADLAGQRLDNYLLREWSGVPRSLVYRLIRVGKVRLNDARARPNARLQDGDRVLMPPLQLPPPSLKATAPPVTLPLLHEDNWLLAVEKPESMAVHGGSGISHGVIERLRAAAAAHDFLELAHRLDRGTSGVLLLAKKRVALRQLQAQWRRREVKKRYTALVWGCWTKEHRLLNTPLKRLGGDDGDRRVVAAADGKTSITQTWLLQQWDGVALVSADIATGRTHQLRVHLANAGMPIIGDDKYGDFVRNRAAVRDGYKRLFLHATRLVFAHPQHGERMTLTSPPPPEFVRAGEKLKLPPARRDSGE